MFEKEIISSTQNPRIKNIIKLSEKSRERKKNNLFVVEGIQENKFALKNNYQPKEFYVCSSIFKENFNFLVPVYQITESIYDKIAFRGTTEGIIGIYHEEKQDINSIQLPENPKVLIIESIEKPGNLGAILRSCEAFSVDLLIICDEKVDVYNPNVIRSSVGCVFPISIISCSKEESYEFCKNNNLQIFTTFMNETAKEIWKVELKNCALVFGTEHSGISPFWLEKTKQNIIIPMTGTIDSLNVSNAIAICLYEMNRQRGK